MRGVRKNPRMVARLVEGRGFLVPVEEDFMDMRRVFELNELGWFIWERLEDADDLDSLAGLIAGRFTVDPERARADARAFIRELLRVGALTEEEA